MRSNQAIGKARGRGRDLTDDELKTIVTEALSTVAIRAATAASQATAAKMRYFYHHRRRRFS